MSGRTQDRFRQYAFRAVLSLLEHAARAAGGIEPLLDAHPFLAAYLEEAASAGLEGVPLDESIRRWDERLRNHDGPTHPVDRMIASTGLDPDGASGWFWCGLVREDPRFAAVLQSLLGRDGAPTRATLSAWIGEQPSLGRLVADGWLEESESSHDKVYRVPQQLWDAIRGSDPSHCGAILESGHPDGFRPVFPPETWQEVGEPADGRRMAWLLQGAPSSGRSTLAGWIASREGKGLLRIPSAIASAPWIGPLSAVLDAVPMWSFETVPGEKIDWTMPAAVPLGAILRVSGDGTVRTDAPSRRVELRAPDRKERLLHWIDASGAAPEPRILGLRLSRGAIRSIAHAVPSCDPEEIRREIDARGRHLLDGIARRLPPPGPSETLELSKEGRTEFDALVARCNHRELLAETLPGSFGHGGTGVRALFKGPSGTGKTLGARHLAMAIDRPLHRLDLSLVVSKWIGETEKNLEKAFQGAEALDAVLLLDEGDALLAPRTGVGSSNDRYANLETNFLLQRIESFDGILVATTNAFDRIDPAFLRRFDAVVEFPLPEPYVRLALWRRHLPAGHTVADFRLEEIAAKCALSGGAIRNAALHATLLSLDRGVPLSDATFVEAVRREYRRASMGCPAFQETA